MNPSGWSLEVVRGVEVGRRYALTGTSMVLGNAPNADSDSGGAVGLDLSLQEGSSPRRMAARQAQLDHSPQGPVLRDLDSPGGTFVNRQRLLPGQARLIAAGDLIQLGGVQLKLLSEVAAPASKAKPGLGATRPPASAGPNPTVVDPTPQPARTATTTAGGVLTSPFVLRSGGTCRRWDDFLTISAQRWDALRDELASGRLAAFLTSNRLAEFAPDANEPGTPDERLDAWLARIPTTEPALPELEVHPAPLTIRVTGGGGGAIRQTIALTNVGYRLLRSTIRAEDDWIRLPASVGTQPIVTVERTEVPLEIRIPEGLTTTKAGALVVESNGGVQRVIVRLERSAAPESIPESAATPDLEASALVSRLERTPVGLRLGLGVLGGLAVRFLVACGESIPITGGATGLKPGLRGPVVLLAALGCGIAAVLAARAGERRDVPPAAFTGAFLGILTATLAVAVCQAIEPPLGVERGRVVGGVGLLWAALGAGVAGVSLWLAPPRAASEAGS